MSASPGRALDLTLPAGPTRVARVVSTTAAAGDFTPTAPGVQSRRRAVVDRPWTWLHQVHGADVVTVEVVGGCAGASADAAVTACDGVPLSVRTADCVPIALVGDAAVGVVHAGWRGLAAGVVGAAVAAVTDLDRVPQAAVAAAADPGRVPMAAVVGPSICPLCYRFGADDARLLADAFGGEVISRDRTGRTALDLRAAARIALAAAGVGSVEVSPLCTSCDEGFWSHRRSADTGRQTTVVWMEESTS